jgi:threonine/homoserine/homoserine lactone efflux protein
MRSLPAFLAVAVLVTLSPGPAFALLIQVAARDGWRIALANIAGNSVGVFGWGALSAVGVASLVAASRVAYDALHYGGAIFLVYLGLRAVFHRRRRTPADSLPTRSARSAWQAGRRGLINSAANPKLAVFFVSLFPQFVSPGHPLLPAALAMAATIVALDVIWYGSVAYCVDRFRQSIAPSLLDRFERVTGALLLGIGTRLVIERP